MDNVFRKRGPEFASSVLIGSSALHEKKAAGQDFDKSRFRNA